VDQVRAGTYANLEDFALSRGDDLLANSPDGLRIAQLAYEKGIWSSQILGLGGSAGYMRAANEIVGPEGFQRPQFIMAAPLLAFANLQSVPVLSATGVSPIPLSPLRYCRPLLATP
jgi:hypothetical protein